MIFYVNYCITVGTTNFHINSLSIADNFVYTYSPTKYPGQIFAVHFCKFCSQNKHRLIHQIRRDPWVRRDPWGIFMEGPHRGADEKLVVAEINLGDIAAVKAFVDSAGHPSRPEILQLRVDREAKTGLLE